MFPLNQWYVAGFAWELQDQPLARKLLNCPIVMFRSEGGGVAALEDRCCHRAVPLSCGTLEGEGIRCGCGVAQFGLRPAQQRPAIGSLRVSLQCILQGLHAIAQGGYRRGWLYLCCTRITNQQIQAGTGHAQREHTHH